MGWTTKSNYLNVPNYCAIILKNEEKQVKIHQYHFCQIIQSKLTKIQFCINPELKNILTSYIRAPSTLCIPLFSKYTAKSFIDWICQPFYGVPSQYIVLLRLLHPYVRPVSNTAFLSYIIHSLWLTIKFQLDSNQCNQLAVQSILNK